jgi:hypothetical protein
MRLFTSVGALVAATTGSNALKVELVTTLRAFERVHVLGVNAKHEHETHAKRRVSTCGDERAV